MPNCFDAAVRTLPFEGLFDPRKLARALVALAWLACAAWVWRRRLAALEASTLLIGAALVLSPTLHPWYVTWIVPFLAFRRSFAFAWLVAVAPLSYVALFALRTGGVWREPGWLWPCTFVPFFALLALDLRAARSAS